MRTFHALVFLAHFLAFSTKHIAGQNPDTFCSRLYHSSIIINDKLYVDGGELRERNSSQTVKVTLQSTIDTIDLAKPWGNEDRSLWSHILKNKTDGSGPPSLNDGSIFSNDSHIYLFGGAVANTSGPHPLPPPNVLWQYNINADQWTEASPKGDSVQRIIQGSTAQSSKSQGYYLGGAIDPRSDAAFLSLLYPQPYLVQGLLEFDLASVEFSNVSTSAMDNEGTIAGGFMVLIESFGAGGVLIAFGGIKNTPGTAQSLGGLSVENSLLHRELSTVSIFDIANQKWYQQSATGDIPPWRFRGCAVFVSAQDKSSHSIYVFGGWGGNSKNSDGNVYVLSIPSFRWIQVMAGGEQRQRHNCHLLGSHTMLVVGGIRPNNDQDQSDDVSFCDTSGRFTQGLGIFSLNDHSWKTNYDPGNGTGPYQIYSSISNVIGGDENGGADLKEPSGGFSDPALSTLLTIEQKPTSTNPATPSSSSSSSSSPSATSTGSNNPVKKKISGGAIAGIVIGVVLLICCSAGAAIFILLRKRSQHDASAFTPISRRGELDAVVPATEMAGHPNDQELPGEPEGRRYQRQDSVSQRNPLPEFNQLLGPQEIDAREAQRWRGMLRDGTAF